VAGSASSIAAANPTGSRSGQNLGQDQAAVNATIGKIEAKPGSLHGQNAGAGLSPADLDAAIAKSNAKSAAATHRTVGRACG